MENRLVGGRYRLLTSIGQGGMGVVWRARDEVLMRTVAVKQLLPPPGLDAAEIAEARARAMREGRIAARLQHPNVVYVHDVVEQDDTPWLIMEFIPSRSLADVLDDHGRLPPREVARIGSQVAAALAATHAVGVVHRDVKPGNVLLANDGAVKITDFGISRAVDEVVVTATSMLAGTPAYLAPEVARGGDATAAADVFSLGSTLYAAVDGDPPFGRHDNALAILHAVARGHVDPPRSAGPLTDLLMHMLRAEPRERPVMAQVRDELAALAHGRPATRVQPLPQPPTPTRPAVTTVAAAPAFPTVRHVPEPPREEERPEPPAPPMPKPPRPPRLPWLRLLPALGLIGAVFAFVKGISGVNHDVPTPRPAVGVNSAAQNDTQLYDASISIRFPDCPSGLSDTGIVFDRGGVRANLPGRDVDIRMTACGPHHTDDVLEFEDRAAIVPARADTSDPAAACDAAATAPASLDYSRLPAGTAICQVTRDGYVVRLTVVSIDKRGDLVMSARVWDNH